MLKTYGTIKAKWHMFIENVTNPFKAEFPQNRQKGQNITKPLESKPFPVFYKLQNEAYLETQNYKTNQLQKEKILKTNFTKRVIAKSYGGKAAG